jgi:phosphate transport system protein
MEARKVQKAGGSTFTVSLPKEWAEERLSSSDTVLLDLKESSVEIHLADESESKKVQRMDLRPERLRNVRRVIAGYISGVDEVVAAASSRDEMQRFGRELSDRLIGLEVTERTEEELRAKNISDISQFSTRSVLRRVDGVLETMFDELVSGSGEVLEEREQEVDRLQFLAVRQLHEAVEDTGKMKELGISSRSECLNLRLVFRDAERISDHLYFISKHGAPQVLGNIREVYTEAMESYIEGDVEKAEAAIDASFELESELEPSNQVERSVRRVNRLSKDIAETSLNQNFEPTEITSSSL